MKLALLWEKCLVFSQSTEDFNRKRVKTDPVDWFYLKIAISEMPR